MKRPVIAIGLDAAAVRGDLSIRAETAYAIGRYLDIRRRKLGVDKVRLTGGEPLVQAETAPFLTALLDAVRPI